MAKRLYRKSYAEVARMLGDRQSLRINGSNSRLERRDGGAIAYRLHWTDIVTFYPDNTAVLETNDYKTPTTQRHMGLAATVRQVDFVWYVGDTPYYDGMRVNLDTGAVIE